MSSHVFDDELDAERADRRRGDAVGALVEGPDSGRVELRRRGRELRGLRDDPSLYSRKGA